MCLQCYAKWQNDKNDDRTKKNLLQIKSHYFNLFTTYQNIVLFVWGSNTYSSYILCLKTVDVTQQISQTSHSFKVDRQKPFPDLPINLPKHTIKKRAITIIFISKIIEYTSLNKMMKSATVLTLLFAVFLSTDAFSPGCIKSSTSTKLSTAPEVYYNSTTVSWNLE